MVVSNLIGYGTGYPLLILIFKKIYENSGKNNERENGLIFC